MTRGSRRRIFADERSPWLLLLFVALGPATIWAGELVHEVLGHCLFIYLLGGGVTEIFVSPLAPYIPSKLVWEASGIPVFQQALIASAGIATSLTFSFAVQFVSSRRDLGCGLRIALFWLSFWTFINTVAYMIIGMVLPYGDIEILMALGVISNSQLGLMGMALVLPGVYLISRRLAVIMSEVFAPEKVESFTMMFWILLPLPLIAAELMRSPTHPPPLIGGSILVLLLPATYFLVSHGISLISWYDPREQQMRLKALDQGL
ncbi:hypothetical protein DRO42_01980 [Candidatus Bathyarchaeota archaeon]|nr:MAG: hypothetical protein DRO42_01980 [Candidatus Bathyarchaeota archaeon]